MLSFREAFAAARRAFLRTYQDLSEFLDKLYEKAEVICKGCTEHYQYSLYNCTVFRGTAGIAIFFDDGTVWYALPPIAI